MRKFVIAASTVTLLLTGIATATADPVALTAPAPAAAAQPATDTSVGVVTGSVAIDDLLSIPRLVICLFNSDPVVRSQLGCPLYS